MGRAFTQAYPGIKVNVVRSTSQVAYQRLSQDIQAGVAQCDFFSSTDYGHYLFLKREGKLLPYRPHNMDELIPEARNAEHHVAGKNREPHEDQHRHGDWHVWHVPRR